MPIYDLEYNGKTYSIESETDLSDKQIDDIFKTDIENQSIEEIPKNNNVLETASSILTSPFKKLADITTIENKPQNIEPSLRAMTTQEQTRKQTPQEQQINAEVEQRARDMQFERLGDKINLTSAGLDTTEELDKLKKKQQYAVMSAELPVLAMTGGIPLAVAGGIEGIKQVKNLIVQTSKGEKYNPWDIRVLSELLPQNTPEYARLISSLAEMGTDVAVLGVGANMGRKFAIKNSVDTIKNKMSKAGYDQPTIDKVSSKLEQSIVERELGINPKNVIGEQPPPIDIDEAIKMNIQARTAKIPPAVKTEPINVTPKTEPIVPKEVVTPEQSLMTEARKYKSADEFVNKVINNKPIKLTPTGELNDFKKDIDYNGIKLDISESRRDLEENFIKKIQENEMSRVSESSKSNFKKYLEEEMGEDVESLVDDYNEENGTNLTFEEWTNTSNAKAYLPDDDFIKTKEDVYEHYEKDLLKLHIIQDEYVSNRLQQIQEVLESAGYQVLHSKSKQSESQYLWIQKDNKDFNIRLSSHPDYTGNDIRIKLSDSIENNLSTIENELNKQYITDIWNKANIETPAVAQNNQNLEEINALNDIVGTVESLGRDNLPPEVRKILDKSKQYISNTNPNLKEVARIQNKLEKVLLDLEDAKYNMEQDFKKEQFRQSYGTTIGNKTISTVMKNMVSAEIPEWNVMKIPDIGEYNDLPEEIKKAFFHKDATRTWDEVEELLERQGISTGLFDYLTQKYINANRLMNTKKYNLGSVSKTQIPTIGALPTESIKETDFKLYQRSLDLANKYKSGKIAESKYRPRKTLGVYYNNTKGKGNIYLKSLNNIEVVSHELVHDIDAQNGLITNLMNDNSPTSTQIKSELRKSYNDNYGLISKSHSKERKLQEGLAMVIQLSAVNPEYVAKNYPKALEFAMNNKILKEFRDESRQIIIDYEGLSAVDKIKSMGYVKDNKSKKISKIPLKTKLDTQFFDSEAPLDLLKVGNELHSDIYLTAKGSRTVLNGVIKNNLTNTDGSFYVLDSDGLPAKVYNENFYTLGVKIDNANSDFREYLKARRFYSMLKQRNIYPSLSKEYTELNSILKKNSLSDETIENAYKTLDTQVNRDLATEYDKLIKFNLDTLLNSRLIKQDFYQEMLDNKGYTPLNRVQYNELVGDDITDLGNFTSMSSKNLKQMTGSDLPIIDPYLSTINLMIQTNKKAYRQIFNNKFLNVIDEYSDLMQRVPYRQGMENDKTILMAKDSDGTYAPIQMNAYIKETVDKLFEIVKPNIIEQILLFPTQFFTKMTTGKYPVFALTNLSIDQVTAFVNSKNGYLPFYTGIETFIKMLKYPQLKKYADEYSDLFGIDNNTLLGTLEMENYNFKKASNKFNPIKMFDKYLTLPANLSETFSRETEYIQARLNGRTVQEAKRMADEITGPFGDKGRWFGRIGQVLIKSIPFFNPTLQISRQTLRSLGNKGNRNKFFLVLLLATLLKVQGDRTILDSEDEEDRQAHMQLMAEQIAMYLYYSKKGNGLYKIKIDQAYLFVGALATMIYNSTKNGYDYNIADYVNAGTSFIPDQVNIFNAITDLIANKDYSGFEKMGLTSMPHLAKIFTSMMFGKKTFPTVMNIVPQSLSRKEPYLQYNERTSDVAKYLGKTLNLSPMKIDDFVDNVLGRASRLGIRSTETLLRSVQGKENKYNLKALSGMNPFWQQTYPSSGRFTKKAYDIKNQLAQFKDTSKNNRDEMTPEKRQFVNKNKGLLLRFNLATKLYNKLNKGIRDGKIKDDTQTQIRKLKLEKQLFEIEQKLANKN